MKIKNLDQLKSAFKLHNMKARTYASKGVRVEDVDKFAPVVEKLLDCQYNKDIGFSFAEIVEAMSSINNMYCDDTYVGSYYNDSAQATIVSQSIKESKENSLVSMCEAYAEENSDCSESLAFTSTNVAQAPYPLPAVKLVTFNYTDSVVPYLAHIFDLATPTAMVYYTKLTAKDAEGNVVAGDLLGSPKEMPVQTTNFVSSREKEQISLVTGTTSYTKTLAKTIMPGTLAIKVDGEDGVLVDSAANAKSDNAVKLLSFFGMNASGTYNYTTKALAITLDSLEEPTGKIYIEYDRMEQTIADAAANIAEVDMTLESVDVSTEDMNVRIDSNLNQEVLARNVFGLDWNSEIERYLHILYDRELGNKVVANIAAAIPQISRVSHDVSNNIANGGNNALFNTQFVSIVMNELDRLIVQASGQGGARTSTIVIHSTVMSIIKGLPKFVEDVDDNGMHSGGLYRLGKYGNVPVLVAFSNILSTGEIIAVHKSSYNNFLTPCVVGEFLKPVIRNIFAQEQLGTTHRQLIASVGNKVVAPTLAAKLTLSNISSILN